MIIWKGCFLLTTETTANSMAQLLCSRLNILYKYFFTEYVLNHDEIPTELVLQLRWKRGHIQILLPFQT